MISKFNHYINESVYKDQFLYLYNHAPTTLKNEIEKSKYIEQNPFWHVEGVVYNHIKIVTNRLENCYHDINLTLSGFFHDLGKNYTTIFNDKKDSWSSPGHEDISVEIVNQYKNWINEMGGDVELITYIVENHMRYKHINDMRISQQVLFMEHEYFPYVQKFSTADYGGSDLNCKLIDNHIDILKKNEKFKVNQSRKKLIASKFNGDIIREKYPDLNGPLLGITIMGFKKNYHDFDEYVLSNTPEQIMKDFDEFINKK